jgi:hypothetical protein
MQAITTTTRGLAVLFGTQKDRLAGLALVAAALFVSAWLCSLGLR